VSLGVDDDVIAIIAAAARPDPLNPKRWRHDPQSVDAQDFRGSSVLEMPDAPPQRWIIRQPGVDPGRIEKRPFSSAALKNEREIAVYLPPQYSPRAEPYPLLVLFDEHAYLNETGRLVLIPTTILDNLIAAGRIPPVVALFVSNAAGARDRVAGSSLGGLAAACAGLLHPETFGSVLSQSGSFHWIPPSSADATDSSSEPNWVARQFISSPGKLPRFYLDAGSAEFDAIGDNNSILASTRALRDVLRAKGCEVHFQEFAGGHDYLGWRGTLADGLIALMGTDASNAPGEHAPEQ
jgi:enterochelin esterase family protein